MTVLYGDEPETIGGGQVQTLVQDLGDNPSTGDRRLEAEDRFGTSLGAADIDNDGFTDLLVGTPYEDAGTLPDSGMAQVIWGSSEGLGKGEKASTELTQSSFGRTAAADF